MRIFFYEVTGDTAGHNGRAQLGEQVLVVGCVVVSEELDQDFTQVDLLHQLVHDGVIQL